MYARDTLISQPIGLTRVEMIVREDQRYGMIDFKKRNRKDGFR